MEPEICKKGTKVFFKRCALAALAVLGLELAARFADALFDFSTPVHWMLSAVTPETELDREKPSDPPEPGRIAIRELGAKEPESYVLGGHLIPDASRDHAWRWLSADELHGQPSVFVLGESAAFGYPYPYARAFASILEAEAQTNGWNVFNASRPGINSVDLVPMADRIVADFNPRQLVVMSGNNEFIHWQPTYWPFRNRLLAMALRAGRYSRLVDAAWFGVFNHRTWAPLQAGANINPSGFHPHAELTGYAYAAQYPYELYLPFDAAAWQRIRAAYLDRFERNLRHIAEAASARNVSVILMTNPLRLRLSPAWKHPQPLADQTQDIAQARAEVQAILVDADAGRWSNVLARARFAADQFTITPIFPYLAGVAQEHLLDIDGARASYRFSRERMIGNLGSVTEINDIIRRVAADTGATMIDIERVFEQHAAQNSEDPIDPLMDDDCHPNVAGHRLIAELLRAHMAWNE